ncbi:hypothetical protein B0T17DRAFT_372507 [Bombardia bombarda]|uniref:Uncharacterized protein n=1 Tax=Bombardia bombarda TaxID=252184 RepID=A0AA39WGG3_9PEZI|nr:hypothetical protein B0T17DRAFT_372507 [Bombardia bombarda]
MHPLPLMVLCYLLHHRLGREHSLLPPKVILWVFIVSDAIATLCQIAGAALIGVSQTKRRDPTTANQQHPARRPGLPGLCHRHLHHPVGCLHLPRAIADSPERPDRLHCRLFRHHLARLPTYRLPPGRNRRGSGGGLSTKEVFFGTLEFAPVMLAVMLFAVWHPGRCVGAKISATEIDGNRLTW